MRETIIKRDTKETKIELKLNLDGTGEGEIKTGCGFFDHMLDLFKNHSGFDLNVTCDGDTNVDYHHTVEDIGICMGMALEECLGDKKGIIRYGSFLLPMDETLVQIALDISGRAHLSYNAPVSSEKVGDFDTELSEEFFQAFTRSAKITLHVDKLRGTNTHHIIEAVFKCFARSLKEAVSIDEKNKDKIPSSKGVL